MITIGKLNNKCTTLQGLKYGAISQNNYDANVNLNINNIQSNLDSFEYDRTINNDISFALKFKSLENPKVNFILNTKMYRFVPYKTYNSTIKITKKYENMIKG